MAHLPEVAIAILYQGDRYLLQLRDNIPTIVYPGHWAFFGGHLDPGESPDQAIRRELQEEIGYTPPQLTPFRRFDSETVIRHVFHGPLGVPIADLQLNEGWDLDLWTIEQIHQGQRYSQRANQVRPLGSPHQQILLTFLEHRRIEQAL
jgi:8-oxo-dGTP diphosphatase